MAIPPAMDSPSSGFETRPPPTPLHDDAYHVAFDATHWIDLCIAFWIDQCAYAIDHNSGSTLGRGLNYYSLPVYSMLIPSSEYSKPAVSSDATRPTYLTPKWSPPSFPGFCCIAGALGCVSAASVDMGKLLVGYWTGVASSNPYLCAQLTTLSIVLSYCCTLLMPGDA